MYLRGSSLRDCVFLLLEVWSIPIQNVSIFLDRFCFIFNPKIHSLVDCCLHSRSSQNGKQSRGKLVLNTTTAQWLALQQDDQEVDTCQSTSCQQTRMQCWIVTQWIQSSLPLTFFLQIERMILIDCCVLFVMWPTFSFCCRRQMHHTTCSFYTKEIVYVK